MQDENEVMITVQNRSFCVNSNSDSALDSIYYYFRISERIPGEIGTTAEAFVLLYYKGKHCVDHIQFRRTMLGDWECNIPALGDYWFPVRDFNHMQEYKKYILCNIRNSTHAKI